MPLPRFAPVAAVRETSDIGAMPLYAGQGVGLVSDLRPAGDVVRELAAGAARLLERHVGR